MRWTRFQSKAKERAGGQIRRLRSFGVAFQHYCIAWRLGKEVTDALSLGVRSIPTRNYACELVMNGSHPLDISLGSKEIQDRRYNLLRRASQTFALTQHHTLRQDAYQINEDVCSSTTRNTRVPIHVCLTLSSPLAVMRLAQDCASRSQRHF